MRRLVLALFALGAAGTLAELLLLGHTEDFRQWIPLVALSLSLPLSGLVALTPSRSTLLAFRYLMAMLVLSGIAGLYYHYTGNSEFELEMYPSLAGLDLVWESLRGATPALAPGGMVHLGLVGLLSTYRHPLLAKEVEAQ